MTGPENGNGFRVTLRDVWDELQKVKEDQSRRHDEHQAALAQTREELGKEISGLKVKSGVWGVIGALVVVIPIALALISTLGGG